MSANLSAARTVQRAEQLLVDGMYEEGVALLEAAVERFPKDPELRLLFGTFLASVRPDEAPRHLAEAVRLDVDDPVRLIRAAQMLFALGLHDAAESYVARAVDLLPSGSAYEADASNLSGLIAAVRGDDDLAEEELRKGIALDRTNEFFVRDLARFLARKGRLDEAVAELDAAMPDVNEPGRLLELKHELDRADDTP